MTDVAVGEPVERTEYRPPVLESDGALEPLAQGGEQEDPDGSSMKATEGDDAQANPNPDAAPVKKTDGNEGGAEAN